MILKTPSFDLAVYGRGNEKAEKLALVLPGKLDSKDYPHMRSHVNFLAVHGFLALSFDPPGTWESGGEISDYNMTNYLKAIEELIDFYGHRPTLLVGHSRGGAMAALGAVRIPEVIGFIAINSYPGPSDLPLDRIKNGVVESFRDLPEDPTQKKTFLLPITSYQDEQNYQIIPDLAHCTKPKLFIYGTKDEVVSPDLVKEAFEAASEPKSIASIDADHDYRKDPRQIEHVNKLIEGFI